MQPAQLAGNVWNDDILGSLEFATKVSGAKLIAVVAHTSCAAIQGAVDNVKLGHITGLLDKIQPAVAARSSIGEKHTSKDLAFVDKVAGENVRLVGADISRGSVVFD